MSGRDWLGQYNSLKREVVLKRQEGRQVGSGDLKRISGELTNLEKDLRIMQEQAMEFELSSGEIARRQVILENLKRQVSMLTVSGSPLIGPSGTSVPSQPNASAPNRLSELSMNPIQTSNKGLVQRQQDVMKKQDEIILEIGKGVDRLHVQAVTIGEEAKEHIRILDKLDTQVDQATDSLREEAKHAQKINKQTQMCSYYICIAVEVIIIAILLILLFAH